MHVCTYNTLFPSSRICVRVPLARARVYVCMCVNCMLCGLNLLPSSYGRFLTYARVSFVYVFMYICIYCMYHACMHVYRHSDKVRRSGASYQ
jgi:hypothetical protein